MPILINDNTARVQYTATAGQTVFIVPYEFFEVGDLKVYNGDTLLAYNVSPSSASQYSVTGAGVTGGGSITLGTPGAAISSVITIVRDIPIKRITDFPNAGPFNIQALNAELDKLTAVQQNLETDLDNRVLRLDDSDTPNTLFAIPNKATRQNKLLGFDVQGQPTAYDAASLATLVAYATAYADTFTGDGIDTTFTLSGNPAVIANLDVSINGVTQVPLTDYTLSGTTLTTTTPVPNGAVMLVKFKEGLPNYSGDAQDIRYTAGFSGAVQQNVKTKLEQYVSVEDFGAVGDGVTNDAAAIQAAINYAASNGSRTVVFAQGKNKTTGAAYNLGSTTITIPAGEMKLVGQKYTQIKKSGAGAFFNVPVQGYGFEAEGLWLVGTNVNGQYGFLFSGEFNGSYMQGILQAHIHDCWFEAVGKKETVTEAAGGAILVTSQTLGLKVEGNICSQGGYLVRVETGCDGVQIRHNTSNISRSVAVQMIDTIGAGAVEISQNNLANVGGAVFLKNAGYCNVFGNESIPGESEAGALGAVVKRTINGDGSVSLTEDVATGISASFWIDLVQSPTVNSNLGAYSGIAQDADYAFYFSARQALAFVSNNFVDSPTLKAIRVQTGQPLALVNNRTSSLNGGDVYSDPNHPGIIHSYLRTTPSYAQRQGFGTESPIAPFEFSGSAAAPTLGVGTVRISNAANTNQGIAMGWDSTTTTGYLYSYTVGVGYSNFRLGSNTTVLGYSGDTTFVVQAGASQGSNIFRVVNNAGTNIFAISPTGIGVFADNAAATAGGLTVGQIYRTSAGVLAVRF